MTLCSDFKGYSVFMLKHESLIVWTADRQSLIASGRFECCKSRAVLLAQREVRQLEQHLEPVLTVELTAYSKHVF